jgi:hypothetical protein
MFVYDYRESALVVVRVTIIRGRKDCQSQLGFFAHWRLLIFESVHLHLVSSDYEGNLIFLHEILRLIRAIKIRAASEAVLLPLLVDLIDRITPQQIV